MFFCFFFLVFVELFLAQDVLSKSDPQIQVLLADHTGVYREIGKTEMIDNNLNPKFSKSVTLEYYFEAVQNLKVKRTSCFVLCFELAL